MTKVNIKLIQKVFFNASSKKCQIQITQKQ